MTESVARVQTPQSASGETPYRLNPGRHSSHTIMLDYFAAPGGGRTVLDVGCGDAYFGALLSDRGYSVTGIERSGWYTERFAQSVKLVEADLEAGFPQIAERFDAIVCADVLEHVRRPEDLLKQLKKVLKPEGRLVLSLPNSGNFYFRANVLFGRFPQDERGLFDRTHLRFYMWKGWKRLIEDAGYRIENVRPTIIPIQIILADWPESSLIVRALEGLANVAARAWSKMFAYQFIVVATAEKP